MKYKTNPNEIAFFALGGLGEVGRNMYIFESEMQIFVIDSGILFPDNHMLGVDCIVQDFSYLIENEDRIVGLFITHGHEDHIGGIPYLLKKVKIPKIYASGLAVDLINSKLQEVKDIKKVPIIEYKSHYKYKFKNTELEFIRLNHSIPDSFAFLFKTKYGNVIHTGDFKFDLTPVSDKTEFKKLAKAGEDGVLLLAADSTNAIVDGFTRSEKVIANSLKYIFEHAEARIIIATFASNVARVNEIINAAEENKRKVMVFGRSMEKIIEIGQKMKMIKAKKNTIIDPDHAGKYKPEQLVILCTGSQGEPLAALSRIAQGIHKQIKLIPGDTVIFSSSPIPGNRISIQNTINLLYKNGAKVITHSPLNNTHTSGHAAADELRLMQALVKPKYFLPIHGEYRMQKKHKEIAIECGLNKDNCFILENGCVFAYDGKKAYIAGEVNVGKVYLSSNKNEDVSDKVIKERKMLSEDGLFALLIAYDKKTKDIISYPQVISRGFIYLKENEELTRNLVKFTTHLYKEEKNNKDVREKIIEELKKKIKILTNRKPVVDIMLEAI